MPPTTPEQQNEIGLAALRAGQYAQAEPYLLSALEQRERALGQDYPAVAASLNNLAGLTYAGRAAAGGRPNLYRAQVGLRA